MMKGVAIDHKFEQSIDSTTVPACAGEPAAEPEPDRARYHQLGCLLQSARLSGALLLICSVGFVCQTTSPIGTRSDVGPSVSEPSLAPPSAYSHPPAPLATVGLNLSCPRDAGNSVDRPATADAVVLAFASTDHALALPLAHQSFDACEDPMHAHQHEVDLGRAGPHDKIMSVRLQRQVMSTKNVGGIVHFKSAYYGNIDVAGKTFKVVFDTGSGHLILPTTYCHTNACRKHNRYSRRLSTTAVDMDYDGTVVQPTDPRDQFTVGFGTGEVVGVFIEEMICMDNSTMSQWNEEERNKMFDVSTKDFKDAAPLGCMRMRFIAATEMSAEPFEHFKFDGVLGLGLQAISQTPDFNFANTLANNLASWGNDKASHLFSVFLADHDEEDSEITFGGYKGQHLDGDTVVWTDVYRPEVGHWMLLIKTLRVDDDILDYCDDGTCKAVVDTGTSLLGLPSDGFSEIYGNLWHPAPLDGNCVGIGPKLHVEFESGFTVTLGPEDYAHDQGYTSDQIVSNSELPFPWGMPWSGGEEDRFGATRWDLQCKPLLMSLDLAAPLGPKLIILGEPVLRKYYSIYDTKLQRVGFGKAKHTARPNDVPLDDEDALGGDAWFFDDEDDDK